MCKRIPSFKRDIAVFSAKSRPNSFEKWSKEGEKRGKMKFRHFLSGRCLFSSFVRISGGRLHREPLLCAELCDASGRQAGRKPAGE